MLLLAVLAVLQLARTPQLESSAIPVIVLQPARYPFTFVGFGDTRFTNPADNLNSNAAARRAVVDRIADEKPQFLVLNGDLVFNGDNAGDWVVYDRETEKLRSSAGRVHSTPAASITSTRIRTVRPPRFFCITVTFPVVSNSTI